ncbi:MAG: substrate-binding domain-containing protein [Nitrososphaerales archaeon]
MIGKRIRSGRSFASLASTGIATAVAVLVVIIIVLAAGVGYFALSNTSATVTSTVVSTASSVSTETSVVSSTVTSTKTTTSIFANPLLMYSADAYVNESTLLEQGFTAQTGIPMATPVAAGALTLAADIKAGDPVSVFLSVARPAVEGPALGSEFPGWAVAFAADQMGIAYSSATASSTGGKAVIASYNTAVSTNTTAAWYDFFNNLTSGSVKVGISNPNADPAGFRAWIVLELAGIAYDGGVANEQYFVNRMLTNQGNITGASAAALVPALDTGHIQFLFIYKSDIASEGLSLVQLTNRVNLGLPSFNTFYGQATYTTTAGVQKGSAIVLWLTVPKDSTDPTDSVNFVIYTIQNYQTVLKNFGLVNLVPVQLYNTTGYTVPAPLVALLNAGTLVDEGPV